MQFLVSYLNSTDEASPGAHAESHGGLGALLLHGPGLEIQDPPVILIVTCPQLLPNLTY